MSSQLPGRVSEEWLVDDYGQVRLVAGWQL